MGQGIASQWVLFARALPHQECFVRDKIPATNIRVLHSRDKAAVSLPAALHAMGVNAICPIAGIFPHISVCCAGSHPADARQRLYLTPSIITSCSHACMFQDALQCALLQARLLSAYLIIVNPSCCKACTFQGALQMQGKHPNLGA